jgi:hypothetical protein
VTARRDELKKYFAAGSDALFTLEEVLGPYGNWHRREVYALRIRLDQLRFAAMTQAEKNEEPQPTRILECSCRTATYLSKPSERVQNPDCEIHGGRRR